MRHEVIVGMAKGLKEKMVKDAVKELAPGTHKIDAVVTIKGTIKVGEEQEQVIHMKSPTWGIIALLADKVNEDTMRSVLKEALIMASSDQRIKDAKAKTQAMVDRIKAPAASTIAGKVTTKVVIKDGQDIFVENL